MPITRAGVRQAINRESAKAAAHRFNRFLLGRYVAPLTVLVLAALVWFALFWQRTEDSSQDRILQAWIASVLTLGAVIQLYANMTTPRGWTWRALGVFGIVLASGLLFGMTALAGFGVVSYPEPVRDALRSVYWVGATLFFLGCCSWIAEEQDGAVGRFLRRWLHRLPGDSRGDGHP